MKRLNRTRWLTTTFIGIAALAAGSPAAAFPWSPAKTVTFDGSPFPPQLVNELGSAEPMWYCGPAYANASSCPGYGGDFPRVVFRYDLDLTGVRGGPNSQADGSMLMQFDDYAAVYVNGKLIRYGWLDDILANNAGGTLRVDFDLRLGELNEILVFACDGHPSSPRVAPGPTPLGGWDGCPEPSSRMNNFLALDALVFVDDQRYRGFDSGTNTGWQVALAIPEPGTIPLLLTMLPALALAAGRLRRVT